MRPSVAGSVIDLLVIGYGNDLRSDDGAGRVVAERIEGLGLDGVRVISRSQLTPEMSLELVDAREAVFVDYDHDNENASTVCSSFETQATKQTPARGRGNQHPQLCWAGAHRHPG